MPAYRPIDSGIPLKASASDLVNFRWRRDGISADFAFPDERLLRVTFDRPCIVRLLDEMPLSTEEDGPVSGLVADHFAYELSGASFERMQSEMWKEVWKLQLGSMHHFRFVTGGGCMDVISPAQPTFLIVARSAEPN
ncbi:hypothetical protein [Devosia sp.]|uniref:hypothetical protein n=1 Tax=Devosia sp. TaxID=1871048 RepID=UPI00292CF824|nr:hypothetical protein [Devosia sp.]